MFTTKLNLNILTQKRDYTNVKHEYIYVCPVTIAGM